MINIRVFVTYCNTIPFNDVIDANVNFKCFYGFYAHCLISLFSAKMIPDNSKTFSKSEGWLQVAIDNEYINYQKYSTFENVEKIGEGAMGEVFKATSSCYGTTVALKKFTKFTINEVINEVNLLYYG